MSNKEQVYRNFLEDDFLREKNYIKIEDIEKIKLYEASNTKLIEVIRLAVLNYDSKLSELQVKKAINIYLRTS